MRAGAGERRLAELQAPEAGRLRLASALSALSALGWPLQAALVAAGLAALLTGGGMDAWAAAAGYAGIGVIRAALVWWSEGLLFRAGERVVAAARLAVLRREALSMPGATGPGATAALAGAKLDMILPFVTRHAPARMRVLLLPPAILALALWQSWAVALILLITGPLIPVFMALVGMAAQEVSRRQLAEIGNMDDLLVERLSALVDIRLLDAMPRVLGEFASAAEGLRSRSMAVLRVAFLSSAVLELFAAIGVAMVAVYVGFSLLGAIGWGAPGGLTVQAGLYLLLLAPEFYQPMRDLSAAWHDRAAALAVAEELEEWEAEVRLPMLGTGARVAPLPGPASIALRGLVLRRGTRLIRYPDLSARPGESLALMAPSGGGKTTLLAALAGLVAPEAGVIEVAGVALDATTADRWRARLGWMPQAPHFLTGSLRWNVTLGAPGDPEAALAAAGVAGVVAGLPRGLDTALGETGAGLSGGEARRLTLARALHSRPDVLLADEPTADLDPATAAAVTGALLDFAARGGTVIAATHDPALAGRLGRIVHIGAGA